MRLRRKRGYRPSPPELAIEKETAGGGVDRLALRLMHDADRERCAALSLNETFGLWRMAAKMVLSADELDRLSTAAARLRDQCLGIEPVEDS